MKLSKKFLSRLLFIILLLGLTNPKDQIDAALSISLFIYVGLIVVGLVDSLLEKINLKNKPLILILPIIIIFFISSIMNSEELRTYIAREPLTETYRTDMDDFLKTYYLMEKGQAYYPSFRQAVEHNAFKQTVSENVWSWRLPTVFYIWKILPGVDGVSIYYFFLLLCSISLYLAYQIVQEIISVGTKSIAFLSPYLLFPYFHFAARDQTLLQTEWWGMFPMLIGIYFIVKNKLRWAALFFALGVIIRELFVIPFVFLFVIAFLRKSKTYWVYGLPILALGLIVAFHTQLVTAQVQSTQDFFVPRFHGGKQIVLSTLAFGSWEYLFYKLRLFGLFYVIGLVGVVKLIRNNNNIGWVMLSFFIFPVSFLVLGSSVYNDYWGIFYMPFVLISVPLVLTTKI